MSEQLFAILTILAGFAMLMAGCILQRLADDEYEDPLAWRDEMQTRAGLGLGRGDRER